MAATFGNIFRITLFGESHSAAIGVVLDGVPAGVALDMEQIEKEMKRRAPGKNKLSTPRAESDMPQIQSGVFEGRTTGTPICAIIPNTNTRSGDYNPDVLRPSHADFTGMVRYNGFGDYRGGGHFSGRLTAPLVFAGAVAKQVIQAYGVAVFAHIQNIGNVTDASFLEAGLTEESLQSLQKETLPVLNKEKAPLMEAEILAAREQADSVGGSIEAMICGLPAGLGSPFFDSVESRIAHMLFSVPAVKAVEFGIGKEFAFLRGSEANDPFCLEDGKVKTKTNHNGGINGGITNGMPVLVTTTIKPTPSIGQEQETVNIKENKEVTYSVCGRHDPCIVQRAVPVIEAALSVVTLDLILEGKIYAGAIQKRD